jgi:nicotinate-nucleotide--dimethylbenzimidazole phosphoribosyltransferase
VAVEIPAVRPPDADARAAAVARIDSLAVPLAGLGALAELGCWLAAVQGVCPPRPPARARVLVVAADHGIAAAGVSRHTSTLPQVDALRENTAPVAVLAPVGGASVRLLDVGLDHDSTDPAHVRRGSGRIDREDALADGEAERAFAAGRDLVDAEVDGGADLLVPGSLGAGATTVAAVLVSAVTGAEPVAVVGRGSGIDDQGWMRKAAAVRDALRRARPHARDPLALLRVAGGTDLAALAGVLVQAAVRRTPVLLDGLVVGAAALVADALAPGAKDWWLVAQRSPEPAMALVTTHLVLPPLLDLRIRAGDGTGALTVLPLLQMAARLVAETAVAQPEPAPEPVTPEPTEPEPTATEPTEPEPIAPEPIAPVTPEPTAPEPATPEPATPEPATPEPATPEPATPEPATSEPVVDAPAPAAAPAGAEVPDAPAPHGSSAGPGPAGPPRA